MVLTDKQRQDMHAAVLEYLESSPSFAGTAARFREEAGLLGHSCDGAGLLEKKWTSVVRLQRKVMDLEARLAQAEEQARNGVLPGKSQADDHSLPRGPSRAVLSGHRGPVTCLAVHPSFSVVASAGDDTVIKLWDFETAQYERTLKGHTGAVHALAFDPTGGTVASASADMSIKLWSMAAFECVRTLRGHDHSVSGVVWLPSGDSLVSCSRDNTVKIWETSSGFCQRTLTGHGDWVRALAVSHDGSMLASGGSDQLVKLWAMPAGTELRTLAEHAHVVESVAFPPTSADFAEDVLAAAERAAAGAETKTEDVAPVRYVASGSRDRSVRVWDVQLGHCLFSFSDHEQWVRCIAWHPSGLYVLSCSDDRSVRVYDLKAGRQARTIEDAHGHFVTALAVSSRFPVLVTGSVDATLRVWACR
mmetsp:Transcript_2217/g.7775  ORF Transcript_2217/g.7775 Transcript_2217/m.7775 type:complete len:418 (-) Transcript_2217:1527-2780(-)